MEQRINDSARTLTKLSAVEVVKKIKSGEVSAVEVVEAHIQRIEMVNKDLNAVVIPLFEQARKQAKEADRKQKRGEKLGPLHGLPITIKEQYKVAGTQTTLGLVKEAGKIYKENGPLVEKLINAGAIILGKTNIVQTLLGWESDNPVYGRSNNPWNLERSPGGSSGGEAAIIAAGGSALGLAGDFGGSIRVPAHFCGICGLKPTSGRLSNDDTPAHFFGSGQEAVIPQPGPLARNVADVTLAFQVMLQPNSRITTEVIPPIPFMDPGKIRIEGMKIGMMTDNGYFPASPAIRRAVEEAAEALRAKGAIVENFEWPDFDKTIWFFIGLTGADGGEGLKRILKGEKPVEVIKGNLKAMSTPNVLRPLIAQLMKFGGQHQLAKLIRKQSPLATKDYIKMVNDRNVYRAKFLNYMKENKFDALICPPYALPAVKHGKSANLFAAGTYGFPCNVLGLPAGVVPVTRVLEGEESNRTVSKDIMDRDAFEVELGSAGMPVGVQIIAAHWREDLVLAVMAAIEDIVKKKPNFPKTPTMC